MQNNLKESILSFFRIVFNVTVCFAIFRIVQIFLLVSHLPSFVLVCKSATIGLFNDFLLVCTSLIITFPLHILFSKISVKVAEKITLVVYALLLVIEILLTYFYNEATVPLGATVFYYSLQEIIEIIKTSNHTPWFHYLIAAIVVGIFFVLKKINSSKNVRRCTYCLIGLIGISAIVKFSSSRANMFNAEIYFSANKTSFFIKDCCIEMYYLHQSTHNIDVKTESFQSYFPNRVFVDKAYPFEYKNDSKDVLSSFFRKTDSQPNIVIIIVEGLARENSGPNSRYASVTPFLDSLGRNGLYWENCFSTATRTMTVLPSILGSLPFGNGGFLATKDTIFYNSLPKILRQNYYAFNFFYGGWLGFDNMKRFLMDNSVQAYIPQEIIDNSNEKNQWGLYDSVTFSEAIKCINFKEKHLDVFLTLTSHEPISYPNQKYYENEYEKMDNTNPKKENIAVYQYVDKSIKDLIDEYKKHENFENTIFIITGDHNCLSVSINTENITNEEAILYRYHVPLIIWSPLLTQSRTFSTIVSHRDITPSILSFFKNNYETKVPTTVSWINYGLDTVDIAQSSSFNPQIDATSRRVSNLIYKNYFLYDGKNYEIYTENKLLHLRKSDETLDSIKDLYNCYKSLDYFVMKNNKLNKHE